MTDKVFMESLLKLIQSGRIGDAKDALVKHLKPKDGGVSTQSGGNTPPPPKPPVPDEP